MYSTSLGNSVMTSTSCSRGRQKLRFQISRKVRTARDRDRHHKEVPREAEPSRATARAGAAAAVGSCSHHGAQGRKGSPCTPSKSVTVLCISLCGGSHSHPGGLFLPLPASSVSFPGTLLSPGLRRQGVPRSSHPARPASRALGFRAGSECSQPGSRHRRGGTAGTALRSRPRRCPVPAGAGGIRLLRASAQLPAASPAVAAEFTQPGWYRALPGLARSPPRVAAPSPPGHGRPPAVNSQGGSVLAVPRSSGACREGKANAGGAARATRRYPRPAPGGAVPASPASGTGGPGCPCSDPLPPSPRLSPGRAVPPASRPPATAGRCRAAASPLPPPRYGLGSAATAPPPPAFRPSAGPPAPPCRLHRRRRRAMGALPAPPLYFTAAAPPPPRPGPAAGREQVPGRGRPVLPGAAEPPPPAPPHRPRPFLHRAAPVFPFTGPCLVNFRPAGTTGAVLGFSARCFRCPMLTHPFCAHLAPLRPYNSPFPTHPLYSPTDALFPLRDPVTDHLPPSPSSCPMSIPSAPAVGPLSQAFQPPPASGTASWFWSAARKGRGTAGLGSNPAANPKELCGLFCSIFKPQRSGKLELREV